MARRRLAVAIALAAIAFSSVNSASSSSSSSSSSSADADAGVSTAQELAQQWFVDNTGDGEAVLAVGINTALSNMSSSDVICGGDAPSLQSRSSVLGPNGGCPGIFTAENGSCACVSGFTNTSDTWEFHLTQRSSAGASFSAGADAALPLALNASDTLAVDSIRTLLVPPSVTTLKLLGVGDGLQVFDFVSQDVNIPGTTLPLAVNSQDADEGTAITTVVIENIDLSVVTLVAQYFFPSTTLNLTLRNCNLTHFGYGFVQGLTITYLDISSNKMRGPYVGFTGATTSCTNQFCAVQILNLTDNSLFEFPSIAFNVEDLQELYIRQNDITDFNVSESVFNSVRGLRAFESDQPPADAVCNNGTWRSAHNVSFCVVNATTTSVVLNESSGTSRYLIWGAIIGGVVVVVLAAILVYQRFFRRRRRGEGGSISDSKNEFDTFDFDDTNVQVDAALLDDAVIITNRIDYKEVKLGGCLSKGGFGLVFAGKFRGRHVAIKKIRPDRSNEVAEIEQFLKEIILMAQLYHPRIVEFIGVAWDVLRHLSAVTEYMDAGDLRNVLHGYKQQGQPLSWQDHKTTITLHIAEALSYLHSLKPKVIHRDLKSKNVLLNMHLEAKLSDFGISRQRHRIETHMTAGIGTSFWIAPEVLLGKDYDERADIFSFGVVLSEIDTDDYPYWNDANKGGTRGKIREAELLSLVAAGSLRPAFSDSCPRVILELADVCLQKDPKDRPSAAEMVLALQHLQSSLRGSAVSPPASSGSSGDPWSVQSSSA